ncbi:MAG: alpha/beta hydrolase [Spirochaetae bacterium HGW-Spirochaetae-1]|jgi:pimeloyl-ACP methyl ester carboxylesterase|nr:MAG: alpha/beta hydrolase [Spirochaetae bacterium HGW-Spirochaetae-1]
MIFIKKIRYIPAVCTLFFLLYSGVTGQGADKGLRPGMTHIRISVSAPSASIEETVPVDIYVPDCSVIRGDVLVLPGWKFSRDRWYRETDLLRFADSRGFRLIFPEMNITLYESSYFEETTLKWAAVPGGQWIRDVMIPFLRENHGLLMEKKRNYLLGLSTGGRGVALVHLQNPGIFTAGAALSGDFDQVRMPGDRLMARVYGAFSIRGERWETVDNPRHEVEKGNWSMPIYIGHGKKDGVVPFDQSVRFFQVLKKNCPDLHVVFSDPDNAGHDFAYWGSEIESVFEFFDNVK